MTGPPLTCVYVLTLDDRYVRMARLSVATARRHDPDLHVTLLIPGRAHRRSASGEAAALLAEADDVRFVQALHGRSGYFQDNKRHLAEIDADRIVLIDADTIAFGSLRALAARFARFDVAARPSDWVWSRGYERRFAPGMLTPLNGGLVAMSRDFCRRWATDVPERHRSLVRDARRSDLGAWMSRTSPNLWHRDEFALSEEAWSGRWSVGLMGQGDCYLLRHWPGAEDPREWLTSTVLHTYTAFWEPCVARLREACALPTAERQ